MLIFFCLAVLGPHCFARAISSCDEWGLLSVAVHGLLTEGASVVAEQRLQELWHMGSIVVVQSSVALWHVESSQTREDHLALAGGVLSTVAPGMFLPNSGLVFSFSKWAGSPLHESAPYHRF